MLRILSVAVVLSLSASADGLSCYVCVGSLTSDCINGFKSSMVVKECVDFSKNGTRVERSAPYLKRQDAFIKSRCISFTSNYENGEKFIERGCGYIYPKVDICEYLAAVTVPVHDCRSCDTSLCNRHVL